MNNLYKNMKLVKVDSKNNEYYISNIYINSENLVGMNCLIKQNKSEIIFYLPWIKEVKNTGFSESEVNLFAKKIKKISI